MRLETAQSLIWRGFVLSYVGFLGLLFSFAMERVSASISLALFGTASLVGLILIAIGKSGERSAWHEQGREHPNPAEAGPRSPSSPI